MSSVRVDLSGHVAVITGSTSGIGAALGRRVGCERRRYRAQRSGRSRTSLRKLRQRIAETHGVKVRYHGANMLKADEIADLIAFTARELGRLDILVNARASSMWRRSRTFPPTNGTPSLAST
jgi:3-hydroxybutyrate dehydrogenase